MPGAKGSSPPSRELADLQQRFEALRGEYDRLQQEFKAIHEERAGREAVKARTAEIQSHNGELIATHRNLELHQRLLDRVNKMGIPAHSMEELREVMSVMAQAAVVRQLLEDGPTDREKQMETELREYREKDRHREIERMVADRLAPVEQQLAQIRSSSHTAATEQQSNDIIVQLLNTLAGFVPSIRTMITPPGSHLPNNPGTANPTTQDEFDTFVSSQITPQLGAWEKQNPAIVGQATVLDNGSPLFGPGAMEVARGFTDHLRSSGKLGIQPYAVNGGWTVFDQKNGNDLKAWLQSQGFKEKFGDKVTTK